MVRIDNIDDKIDQRFQSVLFEATCVLTWIKIKEIYNGIIIK